MDEQEHPQEPELTEQERKLVQLWVVEGLETLGRGTQEQLDRFADKLFRDLPVRMQRAIHQEIMANIPEIEFQRRLRQWLGHER